ncbi:MAG TPA: zinc-ribbon domain-containing protein, partial [Edaphobacter sp.]
MMIDDLLLQLDGARRQITRFIQENRASRRVPDPSRIQEASVYCSNCGAGMEASDKFCPQCGTQKTSSKAAGLAEVKS